MIDCRAPYHALRELHITLMREVSPARGYPLYSEGPPIWEVRPFINQISDICVHRLQKESPLASPYVYPDA